MHTSPVLIAIFGLGVVVLLVLIVAYLKSKGSRDQDSNRLLGNINSSLEDIMDRVDNLEAQRKAGAVNENMNQPNRAARSDVDEFLAQFDSGTQFAEQGQVAAEVFGVQETEAGVSNDDFWSDFDRPMKKLDGHDRETQASLKPRSDRPMRLSRQTLVPQGEEQVLPSFALPRVGALSPSSSLIVSRDSDKIIVSRQLAQVAIGGICLFKVYDIPFHVCPQNAFSMWLTTTSASEVPTTVTISKRKSALMRNCFT